MHPDIAQVLAESRIADLHRAAASRRLADRVTARRTNERSRSRGEKLLAVRSWLDGRPARAAVPACCPA